MGRPSTKFPAKEVEDRLDFEVFVEEHRYGETDRYDWRGMRRKAEKVLSKDTKREAMRLRGLVSDAIEACLLKWGNMVSLDLLQVLREAREKVADLGELARAFVQDKFSYVQSCFSWALVRENERAKRGLESSLSDAKKLRKSAIKVKTSAERTEQSLESFWRESVSWEVLDNWVRLRNSYYYEVKRNNWFYDVKSSGWVHEDKCKHEAFSDFKRVYYGRLPSSNQPEMTLYLYLAVFLPNSHLSLFQRTNGWLRYPYALNNPSIRFKSLLSQEELSSPACSPTVFSETFKEAISETLESVGVVDKDHDFLLGNYSEASLELENLANSIQEYTKGKTESNDVRRQDVRTVLAA